jgi:hypothetical protein
LKRFLLILLIVHCSFFFCIAQDIPPEAEQQLENLTDVDQAETEDDSYLQQLAQYRRHPLNLNDAETNELRELRILTDLQIQNLLSYRRLFGKIIDIYELQAIPSWDIGTIRKLLPFITVTSPVSVKEDLFKRFKGGDNIFLLRASQVLEKSKGFDHSTSGTKYLGSPQRIFFRYRYTYKNLLQYGIVGDKDAGEQFFKGEQKYGFDFYSFHLFVRKIGIIQALALGDFTVNMGQGLIQWQSLAFKKSVDVMGVKRQSSVLRPYNSAGEFNFHRGAGITIKKGKVEATAFGSIRRLSTNYVADTVSFEDFFSSFQTSGYHRTQSEIDDRNNLRQTALGGNIKYAGNKFQVGLNGIYYKFSLPLQKREEPYNKYAITGDSWYNVSADYSYTYKNLHVFGEAAVDKNFHKAFINGLLFSVDPRIDFSVVYRNIAKDYQAINGNAFTESTSPSNEKGLYAGITIRPTALWRLDAYADVYKFPWLKYLVDAPSSGRDFLVQLTYAPNKQVEIYTRFKNESKQGNQPDNNTVTNYLVYLPKQNWRVQLSYKINPAIALRNRIEMVWYDKKGMNNENGFLAYADFIYKPLLKPYSGIIRIQYFETDGYDSRLYAYENDVLYSYSIPVFYDKGYRYYATINFDLNQKISFWIRWAQTIYRNKNVIGSSLDEIRGNTKSELKLQLVMRM